MQIAGGKLQTLHRFDETYSDGAEVYSVDDRSVSEQEYKATLAAADSAMGSNYVTSSIEATEANLSKLESDPVSCIMG